MEPKKNIGSLIALSVGLALILGVGIYGVVKFINRDKDTTGTTDPYLVPNPATSGGGSNSAIADNKGFTTEQIKTMQTYLLQLGYQYNNRYIIDSIELTGGIDGVMGEGFKAAIIEARDKGYLTGYEDVLARLGY